MDWLSLTLLCALSLAAADAATKALLKNRNAREIALVRFGFSGLLVSPALLFQPFPELPLAFWLWLGALIPLEVLAMLLYMRAIRDFPLSLTLPYLALTPVFIIFTGYLLLGESVTVKGFLGILLVVIGAWVLNIRTARLDDWKTWLVPLRAMFTNLGSRLMIGVAALYSLTSVFGKGAMQYMPPQLFGPFYFLLLGVLTLTVFGLTSPSTVKVVWQEARANFIVGAFMGVMIITHFLAIQEVEVAYMIAVKRTSLLFGILFGWLLFREQGLGTNLFAGALMVMGVFLIAG